MAIEFQDLKIFRDIAHEKSFVKAAKLNFLTQPAISIHLKHLEEELEDRIGREKYEYDKWLTQGNITKEEHDITIAQITSRAKEAMNYDQRRMELEQKGAQVLERLGIESPSSSPGRMRKVQLSQPGTFELQRTFNQGTFTSVDDMLDPTAQQGVEPS